MATLQMEICAILMQALGPSCTLIATYVVLSTLGSYVWSFKSNLIGSIPSYIPWRGFTKNSDSVLTTPACKCIEYLRARRPHMHVHVCYNNNCAQCAKMERVREKLASYTCKHFDNNAGSSCGSQFSVCSSRPCNRLLCFSEIALPGMAAGRSISHYIILGLMVSSVLPSHTVPRHEQ